MRKSAIVVGAVVSLAASSPSLAKTPIQDSRIAAVLVQPYYNALLARTPDAVRASIESVTPSNWRNCTDEEVCETREAAIRRWSEIRKLIPDFNIELREVLVAGDKVIVRGVLSGTPVGPLMGVSPQGRSFRLMTTDIHEISGGKIVHSFHLEDWGRGIDQLRGARH